MPILSWLTRETDLQTSLEVPYRLLEPVADLGGGEPSENMVIQGDNLEALKSLLPFYAGKIKCIFIDPPYNTKSAFEHYDDNLEHTQWLAMIYPRLELLRDLLTEEGSIWLSIDDNEAHYLKVILDEIFGRKNFIANVIWEKSDSPKSDAKLFSSRHDHILVYCKNQEYFTVNRLMQNEPPSHYNKVDEEGKIYYLKPLRAMGADGHREKRPSMYFPITGPDGSQVFPKNPDGSDSRWRWGIEKVDADIKRLEFIKTKVGWSVYFRIYFEDTNGTPPETIWQHYDVGSNRTSKKEIKDLFGSEVFDTPKPEYLIKRIIDIATNPGDFVLDSFLGSGTTSAVAHKMGRQYIGIEMGEHCITHCAPRLRKVVDGEQGGISEAVGWKGGGGFRFYRLGEPVFDEHGKINPAIRFAHLASHIWFCETHTALDKQANSPMLGVFNGVAYYLLYNGILGDKRPDSGNVLTNPVLRLLPTFDGPKVIYGESSRLGAEKLKALGITFKQTPYDIKAR